MAKRWTEDFSLWRVVQVCNTCDGRLAVAHCSGHLEFSRCKCSDMEDLCSSKIMVGWSPFFEQYVQIGMHPHLSNVELRCTQNLTGKIKTLFPWRDLVWPLLVSSSSVFPTKVPLRWQNARSALVTSDIPLPRWHNCLFSVAKFTRYSIMCAFWQLQPHMSCHVLSWNRAPEWSYSKELGTWHLSAFVLSRIGKLWVCLVLSNE
jgi:hypothetical protein